MTVAEVRAENAMPGLTVFRSQTRSRLVFRPAAPIYLDRLSARCGDAVVVHLGGSPGQWVRVVVVRLGWYRGTGARVVWRSAPVRVPRGASGGSGARSPGWRRALTFRVSGSWLPGLFVVATMTPLGMAGAAPLVLRSTGGRSAPLLMVHSALTWSAYNDYGGTSLYVGPGGRADRALSVDLMRPTVGSGFASFIRHEAPLAQFADRLGLAVDHVADTDVDGDPRLLLRPAAVVLGGHSEYWSRRMRDGLVAAEGSGVNVASLGANQIYWHARVARDGSTGRPTSMFVARRAELDPAALTSPTEATVRWQDPPLSSGARSLLGQQTSAVDVRGSLAILSLPDWLRPGTGLRTGSVLGGLVANEADGVEPGSSAQPAVEVIAAGVLRHPALPERPVTTTYVATASGAGVFSAGITYWTCNLTDSCPVGQGADKGARAVVRALTGNVLRAFQSRRFGASHPPAPNLPSTIGGLAAQLPPEAFGAFGVRDRSSGVRDGDE